jgi:hypothetical protein
MVMDEVGEIGAEPDDGGVAHGVIWWDSKEFGILADAVWPGLLRQPLEWTGLDLGANRCNCRIGQCVSGECSSDLGGSDQQRTQVEVAIQCSQHRLPFQVGGPA